MHIIRYQDPVGAIHFGSQKSDGTSLRCTGDLYSGLRETNEKADIAKLLAPLEPSQILCIGLNYRHHAAESGLQPPERPILFTKGINTVQNPGDPIEIPVTAASSEVDYECELAVVIGKPCRNAKAADALSYVLGYTCGNDVSARDWQLKWGGGQWCRGTTFDTFCPLGPCLVTTDEIPDPQTLKIRTLLNGTAVQDWNTNDMIFSIAQIIEFLSASNTLPPGTVILTGTPHGVGMASKPPRWLKPGDTVTIDIERIGQLTNPVVLETPRP
jgi:2-keto-4-pentenoate hydratase/2-oxohepta-3-ene-1,7-dioic acid hydratase in catechol pathway